MKIVRLLLTRFRPLGALLAAALISAPALHAQAQFAGTYIGTINTKVTVPIVGTIESAAGGYIATVAADGTINVSGLLTGTVSASGAVTFNTGSGIATLGIRSATIANNQFSSNYGDVLGNGTTQFRFNPSGSFTAAPGGGTGGGGTGGGGTGGGGGGTGGGAGSAGSDLLAYYSFNDASNPYKDDSGRGFNLAPVGGTTTSVTGRFGNALNTNGVRLRVPVNSSFSVSAYTISYFVKVQGPGNWNPRMVAVQPPGTSTHYYGTYLNGSSSAQRQFASYHISSGAARIYLSPTNALLPTNTTSDWQHIVVTHNGSTVVLYLNGVAVLTQANAGATQSFANAMLSIAGSDNGLDLFQGQLDEIRIYNRALTVDEVTSLRNGTAVGTAASGTNTAAAITGDVIAGPANLTGYRNRVGQSFQFLLTGATSGGVWGTDVYTDDSSVARAAVHAGVIAPGETKTVTVTVLPGQSNYAASTRNGVTTSSWGAWSGSYSFAGASGGTFSGGTTTAVAAIATGYTPVSLSYTVGGRLVLPVSITGVGPFSYQWYLNGNLINGATANPYVINSLTAAAAGTYSVRVTNPGGTTQPITVGTVAVGASGAPTFTVQPFNKVVAPGDTFALGTVATGANVTYQWFRNGSTLAGETGSILLRQNVNANDAGQYTVRVTNSSGSVTSSPATVTLNPLASTLRNISVRTNLSAGGDVTPGFVIRGSGTKRVLVRAVGPGLAQFGVAGTNPDPKFEVFRGSTKIAENDTWDPSLAATMTAVGAFGLQAGSKDAAVLVNLTASAGGENYSVRVSSNGTSSGITLVEVYDADTAPTSKLVNVSVLGQSGTQADVLILGLSLQGTGQRTLLVRGVGPTIGTAFGVPDVLADPQLTLYDSNTRAVISNDDWNGADFVSELATASDYVGAFKLPGGSADAATLTLLDPGAYTIQVKGAADATGRAIIEVYEVP